MKHILESDKYPLSMHKRLKDFPPLPFVLPLQIRNFLIDFNKLGLKGENSRIPVRVGAGRVEETDFSPHYRIYSKLLIYIEFLRVRARGIDRGNTFPSFPSSNKRGILCKTS